jgi:hypothetical protein
MIKFLHMSDVCTGTPFQFYSTEFFFRKSLAYPRVEAGKNTSTVVPESRKRRRNGNLVVSDETVMYGYESSTILRLLVSHCVA